MTVLALLTALILASPWDGVTLHGKTVQGGWVRGKAPEGSTLLVDGHPWPLASDGTFMIGIHRDRTQPLALTLELEGKRHAHAVEVRPRSFAIERIDGLPEDKVTPPPQVLERIAREAAMVRQARERVDDRLDFLTTFRWPAIGRLSGFYGSQRVLNGEPKTPHYGVDVAAPTGSTVVAPAAGIVTLAERDLFYSGGTIILDHGLGVTSSFLHLSAIDVSAGQQVEQGQKLGEIGATGRATGPHLDWRMNVRDVRIDPQLVVEGKP